MEPVSVLHADYLDIVFDKRNKNYGGYELRKHYNQRLGKAAVLLLMGVGAFACVSFMSSAHAGELHTNTKTVGLKFFPIAPPAQMPKMPEPPKPYTPPQHIHTTIFTAPVITDNNLVKPEQTPQPNSPATQPGTANTTCDSTGIAGADIPGTGPAISTRPATVSKPLVWVEQMPQFTGDMAAYINSHLRYPEAARSANIAGRVVIQFVVDEDGSVSEATIVHGVGGGCDEEALKMVNAMPKWKPGKQNGAAVKVFFTLPVNFVLD